MDVNVKTFKIKSVNQETHSRLLGFCEVTFVDSNGNDIIKTTGIKLLDSRKGIIPIYPTNPHNKRDLAFFYPTNSKLQEKIQEEINVQCSDWIKDFNVA